MAKITKEQYLQARIDGKQRAQICAELGVSPGSLYYQLEKWGLKNPDNEQRAMRKFAGVDLDAHKAPTAVLMPSGDESSAKAVETPEGPKTEATAVLETAGDALVDAEGPRAVASVTVAVSSAPEPLHPHLALLQGLHEQFLRKNHDYGDSFHATFQEFGILASIVRMSDKWGRIKSLSKQSRQVEDETLRDTLLDLANYAVMTVMEMDKQ